MITRMHLKILLPAQILAEEADVIRIIAETQNGSIGLLPQRLDFVTSLVPGILVYELSDGTEKYGIVDKGILMKIGPKVSVSVRNAVVGANLEKLRAKMHRLFERQDEHEMNIRSLMDKVESGLISHLVRLQYEKEFN